MREELRELIVDDLRFLYEPVSKAELIKRGYINIHITLPELYKYWSSIFRSSPLKAYIIYGKCIADYIKFRTLLKYSSIDLIKSFIDSRVGKRRGWYELRVIGMYSSPEIFDYMNKHCRLKTSYFNIIRGALFVGNLLLIDHILNVIDYNFSIRINLTNGINDDEFYKFIISNNRIDILEYMDNKLEIIMNESYFIEMVAEMGNIFMLQYIFDKDCVIDTYIIQNYLAKLPVPKKLKITIEDL